MRRQSGFAETLVESSDSPSASSESSENVQPLGTPYVGPRPFELREQDRFYGRNREALDLMYLVLAHPAVLLYAESGAGKSSLINAKLIPMLENKGCHVLPVARVRGTTLELESNQIDNIFVFHTLANWTGPIQPEDAVRLSGARISDELARISSELTQEDDEPPPIVAIVDQFEELFTHYGHRWTERRGLFEQIAEALLALPNLHVLFAMREDYIAGMDSFAAILPEKLRVRYRLEHLNEKSALDAILRPMEDVGHKKFAPGVAERLVDDLMKIRVARGEARTVGESIDGDLAATYSQTPRGASTSELPEYNPEAHPKFEEYVRGESVMPVQLQVVCQTLWEGLGPEETTVTLQHLEKCGDIDRALSGFYERCVREAADAVGLSEGKLRRWFEDKLITRMGTRKVVMRERDQTEGLPNEAVDVLDQRHLIRGEIKDGVRWYELTHDRFIDPIRDSNRRWRGTRSADTLEELETRANAWFQAADADKTSHLLNSEDLGKAEAWIAGADAADLGTSDRLAEFIRESRQGLVQARMLAEKRVLIRSSIILGVLVLVAIIGWVRSHLKAGEAGDLATKNDQNRKNAEVLAAKNGLNAWKAEVLATTNDAFYQAEQNPQEGLKRAVEAADKIADRGLTFDQSISEKTTQALRHILTRTHQRLVIDDSKTALTDLAFHPDGRHVAFVGQDGSAQLWDIGDADNPNDDEQIDTLPPDFESLSPTRISTSRINRIRFNATGSLLVVVCGNPTKAGPIDQGSARIWRPKGIGREESSYTRLPNHTGPVTDAAFSPDQRFLVTTSVQEDRSGLLQVFSVETGKPACEALSIPEIANCVSFGPEDLLCVASGYIVESKEPGEKGGVRVYRLSTEGPKTRLELVHKMDGYNEPVPQALFSLDGQLVAAGCCDGAVRVFRAGNGEIVATLLGHAKPVVSLAFSRDGSRLVTGSNDRTARVWEAGRWLGNPGREWSSIATLSGHKANLFFAEFNPDGSLVLTCSYDKSVRLWDARTGEKLVAYPGHQAPVYTARFSPEGRLIGTVSADRSARIWDVGQVESPWRLLHSHDAAVRDVAADPRGRWTLTASADGTAKLWDLKSATLAWTFKEHAGPLTAAAFDPEGALAATASLDGTVKLWNCKDKTTVKSITPGSKGPAALGVTFSPTGRFLLTSWADGQMRLYAKESNWAQVGNPWPGSAQRLDPSLFAEDDSVLVTPNMGLLQVKGGQGSVKIWDLSEKVVHAHGKIKPIFEQDTDDPVADAAFGTNGNGGGEVIAAALSNGLLGGAVRLWSWTEDKTRQTVADLPHQVGVERIAFHPEGRELVSESEGGTGLVWRLPLPTVGKVPEPTRLAGLTGPVPNLAYSPDGKRLASDGGRLAADTGDGPVQVWHRPAAPASPVVFQGRRTSILTLAFDRNDPNRILTVDRENRLQRWQIDTRSPLEQHRGPDFLATAAAISPDGRLVLTGAADGTAQLWNSTTGEKVADLKGHKDRISAAAFSPDSALVATASWDKTVWIWSTTDIRSNQERRPEAQRIGEPIQLGDFVNSVRFHPDKTRRLVVTGTGDLNREQVQPGGAMIGGKVVAYLIRPTRPESKPMVQPLYPWGETPPKQTTSQSETPVEREKEYFGVNAALCSPDGRRVYLACGGLKPGDCVVKFFDVVNGRVDGPPKRVGQPDDNGHTEPIRSLDLAPDGTSLVTTSADNTAYLWDLTDNKLTWKLSEHSGDVVGASFSPDGKFVMTLSIQDGTARIWDAATGERVYVVAARHSGQNSAAISDQPGPRSFTDDVAAAVFSRPDGRKLITANGDGNARIYQLDLCGSLNELRSVASRRIPNRDDDAPIRSPTE